jgi:hypothetical protein
LLRRFFEPVLFEDLPASDRRADNLYLHLVDRCELYVGLFGSEVGSVDAEGLSPTEREFQRAGERGKPSHDRGFAATAFGKNSDSPPIL